MPNEQLEARFEESYVARILPGAQLKKLSIEGRDEPDAPLVLDFTFTVDKLGHRVGNEQRIGGMFSSALSPSLARTADRTVGQLVAVAISTDMRLRLTAPEGAQITSAPGSQRLGYAGVASFSASAKADKGEVVISRSLRLPVLRVTPQAYGEFAEFCRAVDRAEAGEISVKMP